MSSGCSCSPIRIYPGIDRSEPYAERLEIDGTLIAQAQRLIERLNTEAYIVMDKASADIPNVVKYPRRALHEVVANALAHRDYEAAHPVRVTAFSDRIEVFSPGGLPTAVERPGLGTTGPGSQRRGAPGGAGRNEDVRLTGSAACPDRAPGSGTQDGSPTDRAAVLEESDRSPSDRADVFVTWKGWPAYRAAVFKTWDRSPADRAAVTKMWDGSPADRAAITKMWDGSPADRAAVSEALDESYADRAAVTGTWPR